MVGLHKNVSLFVFHQFTINVLRKPIIHHRFFSANPSKTDAMVNILKQRFPSASNVEVVDVSGGCGAMYEVLVESLEFKGMSIVKQHRLINDTLKEQIKEMHGLRIHTMVPKQGNTT